MATPQVKTGLFVGLNKGHVVTRRELAPRPNSRKGVCISLSPTSFRQIMSCLNDLLSFDWIYVWYFLLNNSWACGFIVLIEYLVRFHTVIEKWCCIEVVVLDLCRKRARGHCSSDHWSGRLLDLLLTRRESLSFSRLVRTRGLSRSLRGSWVPTREPSERERRCLVFSVRWGTLFKPPVIKRFFAFLTRISCWLVFSFLEDI